MKFKRREFIALTAAGLASCANSTKATNPTGEIYDIFDDAFLQLVDLSETFQVLGEGYGWSEGPAWDKDRQQLYFTDVPGNVAYKWTAEDGVKEFLNPSGSNATVGFREPGANGLLFTANGDLLICNHGERAVQRMDIRTGARTTLANEYLGKKFNSPNDVISGQAGTIYFTDPPYGLEGLDQSPLKEQGLNGVYRLNKDGTIDLLISDLTFPNGVALSRENKTLYVSQSDPDAPHLYALDLTNPDAKKEQFVDFSQFMNPESPGLPDGMVVDHLGNIFCTGPGGVFAITPSGRILGRIKTGKGSANCTFGEDGATLFITNHDRLIKLKTKTRGF